MVHSAEGAQVSIDLAWCHSDEWGIRIAFERSPREVIFDIQSDSFVDADDLTPELTRALSEQIQERATGLLGSRPAASDPVLSAIASNLASSEWTTGKQIRKTTRLGVEEFTKHVRRLVPRWVRREAFEERDRYSLTLPGLLLVDESLRSIESLDGIYRAVARRFDADDNPQVFDVDDLAACGVNIDSRLARNMAAIALLVGSGATLNDKTFRMPADDEMIAESIRAGRSFLDYLTHAANERQRNEHYVVTRPWLTAPLCLERDRCQAEYVPSGFLSIELPSQTNPGNRTVALPVSTVDVASDLDDLDLDELQGSEGEISWTTAAEAAVTGFNELLEAIATGKRDRDDPTTREEFRRLRQELLRYQAMLPAPNLVIEATDPSTFWTIVTKDRPKYAQRRTFLQEQYAAHYARLLAAGSEGDTTRYLAGRDLTLGEKIGGGGFGDVFRAEHRLLGARAVKFFRPHFYDGNRAALLRFAREAKILARVSHPRIVQLFDAAIAPGPQPFIVTEFVEGKNLETLLDERSLFPLDEAVTVCMQVLDGLESAHALGVIHRDIKPTNIMRNDGGAKILDFGSGGIIQEVMSTRITTNAQGTLGYMAPELIEDPQLLDPRTDLYSVAVTFHKLITGRLLHPGDVSHYLKDAPQGVLAFLQNATAPAQKRFSDAATMKRALAAVTAERPAAAAPTGPAPSTLITPAGFDPPKTVLRAKKTNEALQPTQWIVTVRPLATVNAPRNELLEALSKSVLTIDLKEKGKRAAPEVLTEKKLLGAEGASWRKERKTFENQIQDELFKLGNDGTLSFQRSTSTDDSDDLLLVSFVDLSFDVTATLMIGHRFRSHLRLDAELEAKLHLVTPGRYKKAVAHFAQGIVQPNIQMHAAEMLQRNVEGRVQLTETLSNDTLAANAARLINYAAAAFHFEEQDTLLSVTSESVRKLYERLNASPT